MHEIKISSIDRSGSYMHLELPMSAEKLADAFDELTSFPPGVIGGYSFRLAELNDRITGAQKTTDLNAFAERLSELSELERVLFTGAIEITDCCDIADCDEILHNLDSFEVTPNVGNYESLGRQAAAEQFANLPPEVLAHLDHERLGRIKHEDGASAFVSGHRIFHNGRKFDKVKPGAEPLQGYCLKLRLVSDANPDGVWIKFPLYEGDPVSDVERGEEIQVALAALKTDSLDACRAAECVCEYPSLNRCVEAHVNVKLTDLVWKARNFTYAESELTQYGKDVYEKLRAALEMEDCTNLDLAADITQNLRCYHFGRDPEAFAESYLEQHKVDPVLTTCFDLKALGEKLVADHGMVSTSNGIIAPNGVEFVYDCYDPAPQKPEQEYKEIRFMCPLRVQTDSESELGREHGFCESEFGHAAIPNDVAADYAKAVQDAIKNDSVPSADERERGLAAYLNGDEIFAAKVYSVKPSVEVRQDELWGVVTIQTTEDLTPEEMSALQERCLGDLSDGWGEHFEQHPVHTKDGDIYVSFWHSGDDYFLKPEQEVIGMEPLRGEPEQEQGFSPTMGGM